MSISIADVFFGIAALIFLAAFIKSSENIGALGLMLLSIGLIAAL